MRFPAKKDAARGLREDVHRDLAAILEKKCGLTVQQQHICALVLAGLSRREMCGRLGIRDSTLKKHLGAIYSATILAAGPIPAGERFQKLTVFLIRLWLDLLHQTGRTEGNVRLPEPH